MSDAIWFATEVAQTIVEQLLLNQVAAIVAVSVFVPLILTKAGLVVYQKVA